MRDRRRRRGRRAGARAPGGPRAPPRRLPRPRPAPLAAAPRVPGRRRRPDELWRAPAPPTAVLALGDTTGTGALIALLRAGKRVPEDVSLIVHGDPPGARAEAVTTIASPPAELGREAAALLLERIGEGARSTARRVTVPPLLNERGTVR
ncbi:substrate-binding domain-containing protein [Actinomadura luteofluorescens]|uniref:substrate-binding domain-containing protein n=1 Tax=Actinomadura luteofluorescens TaxID=46163 RepID=UPI003626D723